MWKTSIQLYLDYILYKSNIVSQGIAFAILGCMYSLCSHENIAFWSFLGLLSGLLLSALFSISPVYHQIKGVRGLGYSLDTMNFDMHYVRKMVIKVTLADAYNLCKTSTMQFKTWEIKCSSDERKYLIAKCCVNLKHRSSKVKFSFYPVNENITFVEINCTHYWKPLLVDCGEVLDCCEKIRLYLNTHSDTIDYFES
jgi:hypothetical protein